jgi:hypothetical protein
MPACRLRAPGENGVQILTMAQLAARLAGWLFRPIGSDDLESAVRSPPCEILNA